MMEASLYFALVVTMIGQVQTEDSIFTVYTPDDYNYIKLDKYGFLIADRVSFQFTVQACHNAHILLMERRNDIDNDIYEIAIGMAVNTATCFRSKRAIVNDRCVLHSSGPLNCTRAVWMWMEWRTMLLKIGKGLIIGQNIIAFKRNIPISPNFVAVSTGFGSAGKWAFLKYHFIPIYTPAEYQFKMLDQYGITVSANQSFIFGVQACQGAHVLLLEKRDGIDREFYEILLGTSANNESCIRTDRLGDYVDCVQDSPLNCRTERWFWINWNDSDLMVGKNVFVGEKAFLHADNMDMTVNFIAISTSEANSGNWLFTKETAYVPTTSSNDRVSGDNIRQYPTPNNYDSSTQPVVDNRVKSTNTSTGFAMNMAGNKLMKILGIIALGYVMNNNI